ncbi:MAG TPA: GTP 3',8-cyclase MoaA [Candidatus Acidoferrales bacterium]|nr:GTP 3',8-cyclase MoaA [Candidatus Acidoferrales bacterium]
MPGARNTPAFLPNSCHGIGQIYFRRAAWSRIAVDRNQNNVTQLHSGTDAATAGQLADKFGRQITDLRVSVTDRCNFRCVYCRSANPENHMAEHNLLSWDELERLARVLVGLGIKKVRVTGGEPLVRPGVEEFISRLRALGVPDISLTTNGQLLAERCERLVAAGLNRINISLDSLDRAKFDKITRTRSFDRVMAGIDAAQASPLRPVKVNAVLVRGLNDDEVEAFAAFARERDLIMRFIEFMPLDADRAWTRDLFVPAEEVRRRIEARWPMVPIAHERSETARKYRFVDGRGEIGLIAPVSQPFCGFCSRIRLTADGKLRTCLFSKDDHDLKGLLRGGASDDEVVAEIRGIVMEKEAGHRINEPDFVPPSRTMVYIGG